jgi:hypothetical protein
MPHIFISYSRDDADIMHMMRDALQANGCTTWTDEDLKRGSDDWQKEIESAIETAHCLVVILSSTAKNSPWVRRELNYAEAQEVMIYPMLARDKVKNAIPAVVISHQRGDIRAESDTQRQKKIVAQAKIVSDSCCGEG